MIKIDHTTLSKNPSLGFYEIGGKIYWDKASALMAGTAAKLTYNDLHWNFNDDVEIVRHIHASGDTIKINGDSR